MQTFYEYKGDQEAEEVSRIVAEALDYELTESQETMIDDAVATFLAEGKGVEDLEEAMMDEGLFGSILGGLTGAALGKSVGKILCKTLGIEKGVLYDLLTSRLVGAALGATIGKRF